MSSFKRGGCRVMAWACMAPTGTGSLVFIDNVNDNGSYRMNGKKANSPQNKQELKKAAEQVWRSITREDTQHQAMSMGRRQSLIAKKLHQNIGYNEFISVCVHLSNYFWSPKNGGLCI